MGGGDHEGVPFGDLEQERLDGFAGELIKLFDAHDRAGLAQLSPAERDEQLKARAVLYGYVSRLYTNTKARGLDPRFDPELAVFSAYRDLLGAMGDRAVEVDAEHHK